MSKTRVWLTVAVLAPSLMVTSWVATASADAPLPQRSSVERAITTLAPEARVSWQAGRITPSSIRGLQVEVAGSTVLERAQSFLQTWQQAVGARVQDLSFVKTRGTKTRDVAVFAQWHEGLEVVDRQVTVTLDKAGRVLRLQNDAEPIVEVVRGELSEDDAIAIAVERVYANQPGQTQTPVVLTNAKKVLVAFGRLAVEAWEVHTTKNPLGDYWIVRVDASTGKVITVRSGVYH